MHLSSLEKMQSFVAKYSSHFSESNNKVLDVGSHDINGSYRQIFSSDIWEYTGLDLCEGKNVDYVPDDPYRWERIKDESFDLVVSGQVLEHSEYFWLVFEEIKRVLKPGGLTCIIVPSSGPEHKHPVDCWRFYPDGMRALCKYVGLEVLLVDTDWEPEENEDGSHLWKDTILIAHKIQGSPKEIQ